MKTKEILDLCRDSEEIKLFQHVCERFFDAVLTKFVKKVIEGKMGWGDKDYTIKQIKTDIEQHLESDDPVDVAIYALFWYAKKQEIVGCKEEKNE